MIVNADAKALEWFGAVFLSKDKQGYSEIIENVDQHTMNQQTLELPDRLTAKKFLFRLIYGGSAHSYANDPDFTGISKEPEFWQDRIDKFYNKYSGLHDWHERLMYEAQTTGKVGICTGRFFEFQPKPSRHGPKWPRTQIMNYPVQGFGADFMVLARVLLRRELPRTLSTEGIKWICTVHDSVVWDCKKELVDFLAQRVYNTWRMIPNEFLRLFGIEMDLPPRVEVSAGLNWKDQEEIKDGSATQV